MSVLDARSRVANAVKKAKSEGRSTPGEDPAVVKARRDLAAAKLEAFIAQVVAEAPPLSPSQVERIRVLLNKTVPGPGGDIR